MKTPKFKGCCDLPELPKPQNLLKLLAESLRIAKEKSDMTREEAEAIYGKIEVWISGGMGANRIEAYFERYLDYDIPSWARAYGATDEEAISELLAQAFDHASEMI